MAFSCPFTLYPPIPHSISNLFSNYRYNSLISAFIKILDSTSSPKTNTRFSFEWVSLGGSITGDQLTSFNTTRGQVIIL